MSTFATSKVVLPSQPVLKRFEEQDDPPFRRILAGAKASRFAWLDVLGYEAVHSPNIAAGMPDAERSDSNYGDVVLERNRPAHQRPRRTRFTIGGHG
jgi:hypothetical protein